MKTITVQSFGAGVQSTALLYLAVEGKVPRPDVCIFSDTGWEPAPVYEHLSMCRDVMVAAGIGFEMVSAGNIRTDMEEAISGRTTRAENPPFFSDGGMLFRKCTRHYKARPLDKAVNTLRRERAADAVVQVFGISLDEMGRMRLPPQNKQWLSYEYPLVSALRWSRSHCIEYLASIGVSAPKSACVCCPYRSDSGWREMRDSDPESWSEAVEFDRQIRGGAAGARGPIYLHRFNVPLDEAIGMTDAQPDLFGHWGFRNECEGMCGI